jgi:hypothetical protein
MAEVAGDVAGRHPGWRQAVFIFKKNPWWWVARVLFFLKKILSHYL